MDSVQLFTPWTVRGVTMRNRIAVSPMCQYSSVDGFANDWHVVHLGSRAAGGAGLVIVEATAVQQIGRITTGDMGIWKDDHVAAFKPIVHFLKQQGAIAGIQLAHAGRKASSDLPWNGGATIPVSAGGWMPVAPSPVPFHAADTPPYSLTLDEIQGVLESFVAAAHRALESGFQLLEVHAAHGYLLHSFLSPLSNHRTDEYGGSFENRTRLLREVTAALRQVWPAELPIFVRLSCTDWAEGGWTIEDSVQLSLALKELGVDLVDCSSGGLVSYAKIQVGPGYQVPFAEKIRHGAMIPTGAVGMITEPDQANAILAEGKADLILLARAMLRDPYWALRAAKTLGHTMAPPVQYGRGF